MGAPGHGHRPGREGICGGDGGWLGDGAGEGECEGRGRVGRGVREGVDEVGGFAVDQRVFDLQVPDPVHVAGAGEVREGVEFRDGFDVEGVLAVPGAGELGEEVREDGREGDVGWLASAVECFFGWAGNVWPFVSRVC